MHFGLKAADLFGDVVGVCDIKKRTGEVTFTGQKMKFPIKDFSIYWRSPSFFVQATSFRRVLKTLLL